jgi:hypothetical protein
MRLHDHNGTLSVVMRRSIPHPARQHFVRAWSLVGNEPDAHVQFISVRDFIRWTWKSRGFASDWHPETPTRVFHLRRLGARIEPAHAI